MKKHLFTYREFIKEQLENTDDTTVSTISDNFDGVKKHLLKIIIEDNDVKSEKGDLIKFLTQLEDEGVDDLNLTGLTEDTDFYEMYLEYRVEIDEKLNDLKYFDEVPSERSIFSLYDYLIAGVKKSVISFLKDIKTKLQE
jgi:hypothetical protein